MSSKEKILETAAREFAKKGFDSVSMNEIAKLVDLNKATLYHHFQDKKTLYKEIIKVELDKLHSNFEKELDYENKSGEELLVGYIKAFIKTIKESPYLISFALREFANYGANVDESLVPHIEQDIDYLAKVINKLNLKRKYKDMNIYVIFCLIHGTINTFYTIQMSSLPLGGDPVLKQDSEKSLDYISEYLADILLVALT